MVRKPKKVSERQDVAWYNAVRAERIAKGRPGGAVIALIVNENDSKKNN
jgi:hypothetical protein